MALNALVTLTFDLYIARFCKKNPKRTACASLVEREEKGFEVAPKWWKKKTIVSKVSRKWVGAVSSVLNLTLTTDSLVNVDVCNSSVCQCYNVILQHRETFFTSRHNITHGSYSASQLVFHDFPGHFVLCFPFPWPSRTWYGVYKY